MSDHDSTPTRTTGRGRLHIDTRAYRAWVDDRPVDLTRLLFRLLLELGLNEGAVLTYDHLTINVWNTTPMPSSIKNVQVSIYSLRRRLGDGGSLIRCIDRVGYMLAPGSLAEPVESLPVVELPPPVVEPPPPSDKKPELDLAQVLRDSIANLSAYIEDRAAELARPRIAAIRREAEQRIAELEGALAAERQRRQDLATETRRQVKALEQQLARALAGSGRPEGAAG
ncbi:winged helix-turn-helix domain-containing protein [Nonomuraea sp. 10N515B]|uniref:winged helix-turn-helix domain-containing protein n=1 Tax=Nonomuraea sp. 10N515B TaxID=3457422 RepID=UPI003FCEB2FF